MRYPTLPDLRQEVQEYLAACKNLLGEMQGSHEQFIAASTALQQKTGRYTEAEVELIVDILHRISKKLGNKG